MIFNSDEVSETEIMPSADAIVNPREKTVKYRSAKRSAGAMVAYKLIRYFPGEEYMGLLTAGMAGYLLGGGDCYSERCNEAG